MDTFLLNDILFVVGDAKNIQRVNQLFGPRKTSMPTAGRPRESHEAGSTG